MYFVFFFFLRLFLWLNTMHDALPIFYIHLQFYLFHCINYIFSPLVSTLCPISALFSNLSSLVLSRLHCFWLFPNFFFQLKTCWNFIIIVRLLLWVYVQKAHTFDCQSLFLLLFLKNYTSAGRRFAGTVRMRPAQGRGLQTCERVDWYAVFCFGFI